MTSANFNLIGFFFLHTVKAHGRATTLNGSGHNGSGHNRQNQDAKGTVETYAKGAAERGGEIPTAELKTKIEADLDKQWVWGGMGSRRGCMG